ncbi:MAG: signal peptidase I [Lachnospiraceae bacterium]|jgi:signal peptidase|nr:signal peptidase I [Lachnospiraceae bacterium]GFI51378.1 signal peptidase I W [Lachnospiraceae bacterium]
MKNREKTQPSGQRRTKGGKFVPALCNLIGTLILISVIATCLPVTVPRFMGYGIYHVVSGSMAPEIPVGSAIYVKAAEPETIAEGDIIAFESGEVVITHRVVQNKTVEGTFTTKGDANEGEDMNDVPYAAVIGRVTAHFPVLGELMEVYTSTIGKVYAVCFAACGAMFNILAGRLRERNRYSEQEVELHE